PCSPTTPSSTTRCSKRGTSSRCRRTRRSRSRAPRRSRRTSRSGVGAAEPQRRRTSGAADSRLTGQWPALDMAARRNLAVVSVIGRDQKGVVARISTYLAASNTNIEDIEQRVVEGLFIMTMMIDLADLSVSLDELILGLKQIGDEMHLEISVRLHGERLRKR